MKTTTKLKIKNFLLMAIITLALLFSSNASFAFGAVSLIRNLASAEYKPTDTVSPYEFTSSSGWSSTSNSSTENKLSDAFTSSKVSVDLYQANKADNTLGLYAKPTTKYNNDKLVLEDGEQKSTEIDDYAMTIQAKEAPTSVVVNKKDNNGNTLYERDADGNFLFEPRIYTSEEYAADSANQADYVQVEGTETYKKKMKVTVEGVSDYKKDSKGNFIFEPKFYDSNSGNSELYVQDAATGKYNKKVPKTEPKDAFYGYKTQSTISLKANSWFVFSFWIWTSNTGATFVVNRGEIFESVVEIKNTNGEWKHYYLFLESNGDNSTSVNLTFYFGYKDKLVEDSNQTKTISGSIFVDNLCVKTISQTDYRFEQITNSSIDEGSIIKKDSMRFDYTLSDINPSFSEDLKLYDLMYDQEGYESIKEQYEAATKEYQFEKYVSRYTDDNADEDYSQNELSEIYRAYQERFTASIVGEGAEFEEDELDENGDKVTDEEGNVVKKRTLTFDKNQDGENPILKLENTSEMYSLGLVSAPIDIKQFGYYKVTMFLKAKKEEDGAIIKLISTIKTGDSGEKGALQVKSQTVNPYTKDSDSTNNWTEVTFYVQGNCYRDMSFQIVILADTESTIYVDSLRFESITSDSYRNQSSAKRFDLASSATVYTSKIENGFFNSVTTNREDPSEVTVPYTPYSWSKLSDSGEHVVAGVVSTLNNMFSLEVKDGDETKTVQEKIGNPEVPVYKYPNTTVEMPSNMLAIYAPQLSTLTEDERSEIPSDFKGHYYGYKSGQFSLSSNAVYKVSFDVFASKESTFSGSIFANLIYAENHVAENVMTIVESDARLGEWQTVSFLIRTGTSTRTFNLELGVEDAYGTVFFKNVNYTQYSEKDNKETVDDKDDKITVDQQFSAELEKYPTLADQINGNIRFVNFDGDTAIMVSNKKVEGKDYYSSLSHKLLEAEEDEDPIVQGELGVVDTSAQFTIGSKTYDADALSNPNSKNKLAMLIYNDKNYNTQVNPNSNLTLSASSYYKISLWVRTIDVKEGSGLTITMNNISVKFENVNTEHGDFETTDNNGYVQLTALVKTGTSSISALRISYFLGTEDNRTTGLALISGMNVEKIDDEEDYNALVEAVPENDNKTFIKDFSAPESTTSDSEADNLTLATFFLVFSSILLVGALVFAIVAFYFRRGGKKNKSTDTDSSTPAPKEGFV